MRPPTEIEAWYLECLRRLTAHYKRLPKINELAVYCDRAVFPTWQALCRLERIGKVRRVLVGGPGQGERARYRFQIIGEEL